MENLMSNIFHGESYHFFGQNIPSWAPLPILVTGILTVIYTHRLINGPNVNYLPYDKKDQDTLKPTKVEKSLANEFLGPYGAMMMPFFLPSIVFFLYFSCNTENSASILPWSSNFLKFDVNPFENGIQAFISSVWNVNCFLLFAAWVFLQFFLYLIVPGPILEGVRIGNKYGTRLRYKINALRCHIITWVILIAIVYFDILPVTYIYDNFIQVVTGSMAFSFCLSFFLFISSHLSIRIKGDANPGDENPLHQLSHTGNSGNIFYDFWMGRTLNPRLGFLDLKYVCELRPGLIIWSVINISFAATQYVRLGYVSPSMFIVCLFHLYYVLDSHWSEPAILTTMDITTDGFGFMLAFGDLTWVPMTYTLQTRYILENPVASDLSIPILVGIVVLKIVGMYIFRSSNSQKNMFRTNPTHPSVKDLPHIQTKYGSRLLTAGWWGTARHMNYFGDLLMGLAWCLPTGFNSIIPYFYAVYFTALLVNRQIRDDQKCSQKYGADWDEYCKQVKYKIIPYIY